MKKVIVISAINFRSGGPLSILNDCLQYLDNNLTKEYKVVALVHDKSIIMKTDNVEYIEFPKSIQSYIYRLYYEYIYFNKLSKEINSYLWLSLHDMSPKVITEIQAVYCHNPSPFYKISFKELFLDTKFALFSWFYKYLYKINIKSNDFVVVQQSWMRKKFTEMYDIKKCIVSHPIVNIETINQSYNENKKEKTLFFYPSFPRVFKNFEVICEASKKLNDKNITDFEVFLTIDGKENKYSNSIYNKYKNIKNINFVGLQSRTKVFEFYSMADCIIFPSKLETWGLPISEFKEFKKPIFLADLEYAHETVGKYDFSKFFNPNDANELSQYMEELICKNINYENHNINLPASPFAQKWDELFNILLNNKGGIKNATN